MTDSWRMSAEDAEEYTRALGQIMSGGWRQIALAQRLGVPEAIGMSTEAWVRERIGGYVRLGLDERREAVRALTDPAGEYQLTQRQAAEVLGVGPMTVNRDRRHGSSGTAEPLPAQEGSDTDVPDDAPPEEWAEPSFEAGLADSGCERPSCSVCGEPHDDDEPCPRIGERPTVGDVMGEIAEELEASGAFDRAEQEKRERRARAIRLTLLEIVVSYPPGVLAEGLDSDDLIALVDDLGRLVVWAEAARDVARAARRPRRVGA